MANRYFGHFCFLDSSGDVSAGARKNTGVLEAMITPAAAGPQVVRTSLPLPRDYSTKVKR